MIIFNGKEFAREKEKKLLEKTKSQGGSFPGLTAILIGGNPESRLYLKLKERKAKQLGIGFDFKEFSGKNPQEIISFIEEKNRDPKTGGIIVELPLPDELRAKNLEFIILETIDPKKDVDCLTSENKRLLEKGNPKFIPPTVKAVSEILKEAVCLRGLGGMGNLATVVVGSKGVVGKGILNYLRYLGNLSNLRGVDKETKNLGKITGRADIVISATGSGHFIKKEMVKKGAVVIDVGIEKQPDGSLQGDVDFEEVKDKASFITPVPGGVGPVTVICLMENLLQAVYYENSEN